jgi:hypothetical protein
MVIHLSKSHPLTPTVDKKHIPITHRNHLEQAMTIYIHNPQRCPICHCFLTAAKEFGSDRCLDSAHWQAAGVLSPSDFYWMAQITAAGHRVKLNQKLGIYN